MAGKEPEIGPTARAVADNVKRLRTDLRLNYTELSETLQEVADWSINAVGIRRIESGERRVTPDDLVALALALGVSPISLLMPNYDSLDRRDLVEMTGRGEAVTAEVLWNWLRADHPLTDSTTDVLGYFAFITASLPRWIRERRERLFGEEMTRMQSDLYPTVPDGVPDGDD
jgi:transcriptional regulator with XRE-family HTH domain